MIKKVKSKLLISIKNKKINVFLLFLLLAFIILIFSKLSKSYTNTIAFRIEKVNVPENKVVLNNSDSILNITLRAHGFRWLGLYFTKPKVKIDFSKDVTISNSRFIWTKSGARSFSSNNFTKQLDVIDVFPDTLVFNYDVNLVKKVPVVLNTNITFSPGFDTFKAYQATPDSIKIIGPKEIVDTINQVETDTLVLKDVKTNINKTIKLELPDKGDIHFSHTSVDLKANVERFTEGNLKIPVNIINAPNELRIKYFPKEVTVTFYTSLEHFKEVKPGDFKVVCDYSKIDDEHTFFEAQLVKTSEYAKSVKLNNQHVEFIILK
ncbi:CdaR family protein [Aestuariivivens insulae]|uniref:CdaR family protein n=1 Tax=Aestuariivivens insulae TaxID=1621988 RepID=UPI001F573A52|nr:YbbR-like domain-containing protein [Aestuariivivens insulae]